MFGSSGSLVPPAARYSGLSSASPRHEANEGELQFPGGLGQMRRVYGFMVRVYYQCCQKIHYFNE